MDQDVERLSTFGRAPITACGGMIRVAFVSSNRPRRCGIATFTADLMAAARATGPGVECTVAAIDEPLVARSYGPEVRWRITQGAASSYRAAARAINGSNVDLVNVQHEFGLYGVWRGQGLRDGRWVDGEYEDHLRPFLEQVHRPVVTTLHTVLPDPCPSIREAVRSISRLSDRVVVMADTAVALLAAHYDLAAPPRVIPHGMPTMEPRGRHRMKAKLGVEGRRLISTFGLVDPRKGLEYMIRAMPEIVSRRPDALYLIAGQTHPDLLRSEGEEYRTRLNDCIRQVGMGDHVGFIDEFMTQQDIVELLLATDVYVTPYLDPNQITSGTLSYALGAGKAVVSTAYLHAVEALADDRGILVGFRDPQQLATAVNSILDDPARQGSLERNAYAYAKDAAWPRSAACYLELAMGLRAAPARSSAKRIPAVAAHFNSDLGLREVGGHGA